ADSIETHLYGKTEVKEYVGEVGNGVMHVLEETHAVNVEDRLFCAADSSLAISAAATNLLMTGVHTDIEAAALRVEIKAAGAFFELEAGALYVEIFLGNKFSFFSGTKAEMDNTKLDTAAQALVTAGKYTTVAAAKKSLSAKWSALTFKASIGLGD
ncbi:MAG TPA: hypothetical protein VL400_14410, partial [Polyangiaceae bacterium]|nr:hypothetical protein [Polyangiaceae bacterium]